MKRIVLKLMVLFSGSVSLFGNAIPETIPKILQQEQKKNDHEVVEHFYEKGLTDYKTADYHSAEKSFMKVLELAEKNQNKKIRSYTFHFLGNIESWKSDYLQSIYYHKKALELFHTLDNLTYIAISNNQIAFAFESLGEYDSTLIYYQNNIRNRENPGAIDAVLNTYQRIAITYASMYNYKQAYHYLQEGINFAEETGSKQSLGEMYLTAGGLFLNNHVNKDIALEYLLEAKKIFEDRDNTLYLNLTKLQIGDVYFKTGFDTIALQFYHEANENTLNSNYAMLSAVNHKIAMVYKARGAYSIALKYLQKSIDNMCTVCPEIQIHQTLIEAARVSQIIGKYEMNPGFALGIIKNGNQLKLQIPDQGEVPIFPKSKIDFFIKGSEVELTFNLNNDDEIESMTVHPDGGDDIICKKVKE